MYKRKTKKYFGFPDFDCRCFAGRIFKRSFGIHNVCCVNFILMNMGITPVQMEPESV